MINVNCQWNYQGAWCKNKNIKRSLFGIGARCCVKYPDYSITCKFCKTYHRPIAPPPSPKSTPQTLKIKVIL